MTRLDIDVKLKMNGSSIKDLAFSYKDVTKPTSPGVTVDKAGYIDIDGGKGASWPVNIKFQLVTKQIKIGSMTYDISFELAGQTSKALQIGTSTGTAPPTVFTEPLVFPGQIAVGTDVLIMDGTEYKYTLTVGAKDSAGLITEVPHDPKIRNGGDKADPGIAPGHAGIGALAAAALVLLLWSAMSARHRARRNNEVQR